MSTTVKDQAVDNQAMLIKHKRFVIRTAVAMKPDSRVVRIRIDDLILAIGRKRLEDIVPGIEIDKQLDKAKGQVLDIVRELNNEITELEELKKAGFKDAASKLKEAQEALRKIRHGEHDNKPLAAVNVGLLKQALKDADSEIVKPAEPPVNPESPKK